MNSPSAGSQTARRKRFAAALLVGWLAFWLATVAAPCCDNLIAMAQAGQEPVVLQASDAGPDSGDRCSAPCPDLTSAQPAAPAFMAMPFDSTARIPGGPPPATALFVPSPVKPAKHFLGGRPPALVPFHLRTSRLLI